ncbi:putative NADP-dependent oxidoreductase YfmJ [Hymenobacter qilianensis]|uniref:NADP-dependent oxidoreductase YfmJ n=2 Tax=Hymenobacter qilianensis TaxID=1385715 RepID=A0ACB5PTR8_9BACT|nr:NADP-dependent oxidoreductase [Hymenobacter qilianensis]QNP52842.1 NADP-dependent oxidoreductase [Hymenobacter qilianensis]GGF71161.1 putative NADP-dependent oxidoreductase YfmJ [Hymenobacter qilianensis]
MQTQTILFASRPKGEPTAAQFTFKTIDVPLPQQGQVLLKALYVSVDPYMRGRMNEGKSYVPPFEVGQPMEGGMVAEVVESQHPKLPVGSVVVGSLPWQEYSLSDGRGLQPIPADQAPLSYYLGLLGMPGITAYFGLLDICQPKAGETVVVSGAAGAVGIVVGQIAKIKGCRVIGIAGSDQKLAYLKELGFDETINYKTTPDIAQALAAAAPNGVDCYFDNVGGTISDAVYNLLNKHARIALCGQISNYNATEAPVGPRPEGKLLVTSSRLQGFIVSDYLPRWPEAMQQLSEWYQQGHLKYQETVTEGFDQLPAAFLGLFHGENTGKAVVKVAEPSSR